MSEAVLDLAPLTREALTGPGVRVLNLGGLANPDVLHVRLETGGSLVVKDYAQCSLWVRALAPLLIRHERSVLARLADLPGIPALGPQIDALAFAMEWIDGQPLRLRSHQRALPPAFFSALRAILDGLAERGVVYTDLRSPSNVLVTRSGAPALVDLSSAICVRTPRWLLRGLEERALRKLRARYESSGARAAVQIYDGPLHLHPLSRRIRLWDSGPLEDPVPLLFLPDAALGAEVATEFVAAAVARGRRVIALELPGFVGSRAPLLTLHPKRVARELDRTLARLRLPRIDLVAHGWSGLVARWLAARRTARVRALLTVDSPTEWLEDPFLKSWREATSDPGAALRHLEARIEGHPQRAVLARTLQAVRPAMLRRAYRAVPLLSGPRLGWEAWRLRGAPRPLCPWLAEGAKGRPEGARPVNRPIDWLEDAEHQLAQITALGERA